MLNTICAGLASRVQALVAAQRRDAGEGPVPYIVIVALVAGAAVLIGGIIYAFSDNYLNTNLNSIPNRK